MVLESRILSVNVKLGVQEGNIFTNTQASFPILWSMVFFGWAAGSFGLKASAAADPPAAAEGFTFGL